MSGVFSKHRFQIWHAQQHPYKHTLNDFTYTNPALPGLSNVEDVMNYILATIYPLTQAAVATPADLPDAGNVTFTAASPGKVNRTAHGFSDYDQIYFTTTNTLPAGLSPNTVYFVKNKTANNFEVSLTEGGTSIVLVDTGTGTHTMHSIANAYRVVLDDGDGKAAGYRWEKREGDAAYSWYKIYDLDWGQDSVLAAFLDVTNDLYFYKRGKDDKDGSGNDLTGMDAGQHIWGGASPNTNLTLHANSGDGTGSNTGYVQTEDHVRPTVDAALDLGTITERFRDLMLSGVITVGTMTVQSGSITDSSGTIDFDDEDLVTTGDIDGDNLNAGTGVNVGGDTHLSPGQLVSDSGAMDFGDNDLSTTGGVQAASAVVTNGTQSLTVDISGTPHPRINSSTGVIEFGNDSLTGLVGVGCQTVGASVSVTTPKTLTQELEAVLNLVVTLGLGGKLDVGGDAEIANDLVVGGDVTATGDVSGDNFVVGGQITSGGSEVVVDPTKTLNAELFKSEKIGTQADPVAEIFGTALKDGTGLSKTVTEIVSFPFTGSIVGATVFWNGSAWVESIPDTEIDHGGLSGLADDDHSQYALLAGRGTGQTLKGGVNASNNLTLESTAHGTKGSVVTKDNFIPNSTASYTSSWSGTDLGDGTHYFRDLYMKGEAKNFRVENQPTGSLPAGNVANEGRLLWDSTIKQLYTDIGGSLRRVMTELFVQNSTLTGANQTIPENEYLVTVLTNASLTSISGIQKTTTTTTGFRVYVNGTGVQLTLKNNSTIKTGSGADMTIAINGCFIVVYDPVNTLWVVVGGGGGGGALKTTGTFAAGSAIVAGTGVAFTGADARQLWFVKGSGSTDVDITATPQIAAGSVPGQELWIYGTDDTATVLFEDGNGLSLTGPFYAAAHKILKLVWNGTTWAETGRV